MAKNLRDRGYGSSMDGYNAQQEKKRKEEEAKRLTLPKAGTASGRASSTYGTSAPSVNQQRHTRQKTTQQGTATVNKGSRASGGSVGNMTPTTGAAAPVSAQRMGTGDQTKVSLYDFNRSQTLKNNYGTYDNYVAGQRVTGGGYTSPPAATDPNVILSQQKRQGALMGAMQYQSGVVERAYDKVLKAYGGEEAFNRQYDMVRRMESNLKYLEHQAKTGAISSDAYDAAYNRYTQEFTKAVQMYEAEDKNYAKKAEKAAAVAEYAKASDAFERMKSDYYRFGAELGTQMMAEKQAYDEWLGKIRDEKDIQPEIDSLKNEREAVYEQLSGYEALQRQMTADLSSGSAQNQATAQMLEDSMNLSEEIKRLQAKYDDINEQLKLTEEELTYSRYFYWQSMADANVRGEVNRGTRAPKNSLIDKVIRGEATPDEQQQAIQDFNFSAPNAAMMTDAERKKYEQILSKHGSAVAMEYYNELEKTSLNTRRRMDEEKWIRDVMDKSPDAWAAMNILSVLTKPMEVFSFVGQTADMIFSGEMEKDASYNAFTYLNNAVRNKSTEDIQRTWGQWGAFGYQTGMSMLDFLYNTAITGGFGSAAGPAKKIAENIGLLLMGSEAAADATMQAKERGLSDNQAYWLGVISGAAEIATEKISLDTLLAKIPEGKGWKGYVQYLAKNVAAEASEEGASDMINLVADILITKDQSEWAQAVMEYERQGMTPEEAFRQALVDQAEQTGMSMLGGALSGGGMALGSMAINFAKNTRALTERGSVDRLIRQGMALGENSEAYKTAEALQAKLDTEGKIDLVTALRANRTISDATITDQKNVQEMIRAAKGYEGSEAAKQAEAIEKKTARGETVTAKEAMKLSDALTEELTVDPARLTGMLEQGKASAEDSEAYRLANALQKKIDAGKRLTVAEVNRAQEAIDDAVSGDMKSKSAEAIGRRLVTQDGQAALNEAISTVKEYGTAKMKEKAESLSMGRIDAQTAGEVFLESERIWNRAQERAANTRTLQPRNVTEGMSELERTAARIGVSEEETARVKAIADLLGADVRYYNQAAESYERAGTRYRRTENGRYDRSTGTIWLNAQSTNPVMTVLSHELTHSLEQTEKYGEFKNLVLALSGDLRKSIEQTYADRGLDAEGIDHEIVARYVEERLLTDEQAIRDAVNRSRSFGQWMKDQIDKILAKLGDTDAQERVTLQKARDLYAQALKEKAGAQRATEGKLRLPKAGVQESVTEQMDAEYMEAVESGDMETAQRMVDEAAKKAGYTVKAWHLGTPGITAFQSGNSAGLLYFGFSKQEAARAARTTKATYESYLHIENPVNKKANPINWYDAEDYLQTAKWRREGHDAVYVKDEAGVSVAVFNPEQIKSADPVTYDDSGKPIPLSERFNQKNKDIRFSMSEEVERTDRLIAWHNMNEDALRSALELGGLAMPSWAIKTADRAHTSYGDISVIAPRSLVDPKRNRSSMIFGGDAWTPVFPDVNYKVTRESAEKLENEIKGLVGEYVYRQIGGAALDADNISDQLRRSNGALPGHYRENLLLKYAYLKSLGRDVNLPTKEAELDRFYKFTNDEVRKFAGKLTNGLKTIERFRSMSIDELMQQEDLKQAIAETKEEYYREEMKDPALFEKMRKAGFFTKDLSFSEIDAMLSAAQEYLMQGVEQTIDKREAQDLIDREINKEEFETWALKKLNETVERKGIRNNKELYTPSGNRRSFDALNYEYTLANIVRAMRQQPKQGRTEFLSGPGSVKGAALKRYNDVEQVRAARGRLVDTAEQGKEAYDAYDENLKDILSRMSRRGDLFDAANALIEVLQNAKTERGIYNYMQRELADWYNVTPEIAHDVYNLIGQINKLPMEYFEGKTYDAVGFDETAAVVVPDSISADLKKKLSEAGANVIEYKAGDNADRLEKVNSVQDAAFSMTEEEDGPRGLTLPAVQEKQNEKPTKKSVKPVAESKPIEARKWLSRQIMDSFGIREGKTEAEKIIQQYADKALQDGSVTDADIGDLFGQLYNKGVIDVFPDDYSKAMRELVTGGQIQTTESVKADFGDDWADFRRRAFAAGLLLTNKRMSENANVRGIDAIYQELSDMSPGMFPADEYDPRAQLEKIVQVAEQGKTKKMSLPEYLAYMQDTEGQDMYDAANLIMDRMTQDFRTFGEMAGLEIKLRDRTGVKIAQERERFGQVRDKEFQKAEKIRKEERDRFREMQQKARERRQISELQQKTLKQLKWLSKNRMRAPEELRGTWDELLGDLDIYAVHAADETHYSKKHEATYRDIISMYKEARANDPNFLPSKELERIMSRVDGEHLEDLDVDALRNLYQAITGLRTEFYNRNNAIMENETAALSDIFDETRAQMQAQQGYRDGFVSSILNEESLTPMNVLRRMVGWNKNSAWVQMARQLEQGEKIKRDYKVRAERLLEDFLNENKDWFARADGIGKNAIWYEVQIPEFMEFGKGNKPIWGDTVTVWMTPLQKVHMYLESKNYDNLRHMLGGRTFADKALYEKGERARAFAAGTTVKLAPETVRNLVKDLSPEEMKLAKILENYYNVWSKGRINEVSNKLYGYDKAMNTNYAPILTNQNYVGKELGVGDATAAGVGNLKARIYSKNPSYNVSAIEAFERSIDQTGKFVGFAIAESNWQKLLNWQVRGDSMRDVITHTWDKQSLDYIENLIETLQGNRRRDGKLVLGESTNKLLSNYISAVFGANPGIVLKQAASFPQFAAVLGWTTAPSMKQLAKVDTDLINTYTSELAYRQMGYATPETAQLKNNPGVLQRNKALNFLFGGGAITAMDAATVKRGWAWAENYVRKNYPALEIGTKEQIETGESEFYKKVAEVFEDAVSTTQPMYDEMHRPYIMKEANGVARAFTMFKTVPLQQYNTLRRMWGEYDAARKAYDADQSAENREELRKAAWGAANSVTATIGSVLGLELVELLNALWKNRGKKYRDDDDELTAQSIGTQAALQAAEDLMGMVPAGKEIAQILENMFMGKKWYGIEVPGGEQLNDFIETIQNSYSKIRDFIVGLADVVENGEDWKLFMQRHAGEYAGTAKDLIEKISMYFGGLPLENLEKYIMGGVQFFPEINQAIEDAFRNPTKNKLKGKTGKALEKGVEDYFNVRGIKVSPDAAKEIGALYEAGYEKTVPTASPEKLKIIGSEVELSEAQTQQWERVWAEKANIDEMINSPEFQNADDETKEKLLNKLYDFARIETNREITDNFWDTDDKWPDKVKEYVESGHTLPEAIYGQVTGTLDKLLKGETPESIAAAAEAKAEKEAAEAKYETQTFTFKGEDLSWDDLTGRQKKIVRAQDAVKNNPNADLSTIIGENNATKQLGYYQAARDAGISNETYLIALEAIDNADNGDGNYTQKNEVNVALGDLVNAGKISEKDAGKIWECIFPDGKKNPFPVGTIRPMGLRLPKIG